MSPSIGPIELSNGQQLALQIGKQYCIKTHPPYNYWPALGKVYTAVYYEGGIRLVRQLKCADWHSNKEQYFSVSQWPLTCGFGMCVVSGLLNEYEFTIQDA